MLTSRKSFLNTWFAPSPSIKLLSARFALALVLVIFVTTPALAVIIFQDNFDDGDAAGWQEFDGSFSASTGVYRITSNSYCGDARSANGDVSWTDYNVDVDF